MELLDYSYRITTPYSITVSTSLKTVIENGILQELTDFFGDCIDGLNIRLRFSEWNEDRPLLPTETVGISICRIFEIDIESVGIYFFILRIKNEVDNEYILDIEKELKNPEKVAVLLELNPHHPLDSLMAKLKEVKSNDLVDDNIGKRIQLQDYKYNIYKHYTIEISPSLKKKIEQSILLQLKNEFGYGVDPKVVYLHFNSDLKSAPLVASEIMGLSFSPVFVIGYHDYGFPCTTLNIQNEGGEAILDFDEDLVKPENVKVWYEMDDYIRESLLQRINQVNLWKKVNVISDYRFPVKVTSGGIDSKIKIQFGQILSVEEKSVFFDTLEDKRAYYNEVEHEGHLGIIHNMGVEKGLSRKGNNMTLSVDLGSAGEPGLKYILKVMHDSSVPIEYVEIR